MKRKYIAVIAVLTIMAFTGCRDISETAIITSNRMPVSSDMASTGSATEATEPETFDYTSRSSENICANEVVTEND